jgi:hypothetical protein
MRTLRSGGVAPEGMRESLLGRSTEATEIQELHLGPGRVASPPPEVRDAHCAC